ncbi:MAG: aspartate aminotransferase family protein [Bacilli bacterium]
MTLTKDQLLAMQDQYVLKTYSRDTIMTRGEGCYLWDIDGNRYLDFAMGISVCNLGHCHPAVTKAICEQAGKLVHVSNLFQNENQPQLAKIIAEASFGGKVFFANSGAEANEGLIKFARKWGNRNGGRYEIICMNNSFHGRTLATLAATGRSKYREGFQPDVEGFAFADFNDLDSIKAKIGPKTAAVLVEPVQGEGGIIPADKAFMTALRQLCDEKQMLLLLDEVQCGMGRTGKYFAYQHYGFEPDGMSMAKALGNGLPMGAFTVQQKYNDVLAPGSHASTFGGTALACAAGIAVFQTIAHEKLLDNVQAMSDYFFAKLRSLQAKYPVIKTVRGIGLMIGADVGDKQSAVLAGCRELGMLALPAGEGILRMLPPLNVSKGQIDDACTILDKVLARL